MITERDERILELVKEYVPDWGWTSDWEGLTAKRLFGQNTSIVRLLETGRDQYGNFWSRVLIYEDEVGTDAIFRERINISSNTDIGQKIEKAQKYVTGDVRVSALDDVKLEELRKGPTPLDKIRTHVKPLLEQYDHALHKQAYEGSHPQLVIIDEFMKQVPPQVPLVKGLINQGEVLLFYGSTGRGITTLLLNIAAHACMGIDWLGFEIPKSLRVGFWHFEVPPQTMQAKIHALDNIYPGLKAKLLYRREYTLKLSDPDGEATLRNIIIDHGLDILFLDNLPNFKGTLEENSNSDMGNLLAMVCNVAGATNCAIPYAHHSTDPKMDRSGRLIYPLRPRGGTEIEGQCDGSYRYYPDRVDPELRVLETHKPPRASDKPIIRMTLQYNKLTHELTYIGVPEEEEAAPYMHPDDIVALRRKLEETQEQFANRLGTSRSTINRWEEGKTSPGIKDRRKLWKLQSEVITEEL